MLRGSSARAVRHATIFAVATGLVAFALPTLVALPASAAPKGPIKQLIVKYAPGAPIADSQGSANGDEQLDPADRGLKPGRDIGFGYRTVVLPRFTDVTSARGMAQRLKNSRAIVVAEPDSVVSIDTTETQTYATWGLDRIDQAALPLNTSYQYGQTGSGVTAYIVDTGIDATNIDFGARVAAGYSTISGGTADCNGHGTHVAGTVGGRTYGVAKNVSLVPVRVLDCSGSGSTSGVISGLNWAISDHVSGPAVLNMSLGGSFSQAMNDATAAAVADGITVAVASGNSGANACNYSPSSTPSAITVNAVDSTDKRASFSNYGSCTDIYAPGVSITSDWLGTTATNTISGTSMATPHVTGAAARVLEAFPTSTPAQVWAELSSAASPYASGLTGDATRLLYLPSGDLTAPPAPPASPNNVAVTRGGSGQALVSWAPPSSGDVITGYTARAYSAANGGTAIKSCSTSGTTCTISGLTNGTAYYVDVTASSAGLESAAAPAPRARIVPATTPSAPTVYVSAGSRSVAVQWSAPSNGGTPITKYTATAWSASSGGVAKGSCTTTSALTCTISGLSSRATVYVSVVATNEVGDGQPSSRKSVTPR